MMKIFFTVVAFAWVGTMSHAQVIQQAQVPPSVVNAVKAKFPNATAIEWKLKDDEYRAEFKIDKRGHDVWLNKGGGIKKVKQDISKNDLPAPVKQKLETDFKSYTIDDADKIEKDGKTYYQVKLKAAAQERKVLFTADGQIEKDKEKIEK
jgi:uncharacterized membrane protein YkoI